jgi:hypothetical protein
MYFQCQFTIKKTYEYKKKQILHLFILFTSLFVVHSVFINTIN